MLVKDDNPIMQLVIPRRIYAKDSAISGKRKTFLLHNQVADSNVPASTCVILNPYNSKESNWIRNRSIEDNLPVRTRTIVL